MDAAKLTKALQLLGKSRKQYAGEDPSVGATNETLVALYESLSSVEKMNDVPGLLKLTYGESSSPTSGLTAYDLEAPAKLFYPVLTPLRNMLPRTSGKGGIQANWRAITGVNTTQLNAGVSEGNRGAVVQVTTQNYSAAYKGIGFESNASFEAQYAGEGFDDVRMRAQQAGLHSLMLAEERMILQGNSDLALGTTPTPSLSGSSTGGALSNSTVSVICVALTPDGYYRYNTAAASLAQQYTRTNADGSVDTINAGVGQKSANQSVTLSGGTSTQSITSTVTAVRGAAAYAWLWGTAGSETLGAITTVPKYVITAAATGTTLASSLTATDCSRDQLAFDGLLTLALTSGSGAYWNDLGGATLTADNEGGCVEINNALKDRWDNYRLNPEIAWISSQDVAGLKRCMASGSANGALRFNIDAKQGMMMGGIMVASYLNPYGLNGATELEIRQHPYLTPGTIMLTQSTLPYPMNDTPNVMQIRARQDYYSIEWPWRSRKYEYGVYADEVLQLYFPPAVSVITGVAAG